MIRAMSRLIARFKNNAEAENALKAVNDTLSAADKEVAAVFERQNGIAYASDVASVYVRHGFRNDCGWQQTTPIFVEESTLRWEIPDGMHLEDAEQLLQALGAISVREEETFDDDLLRRVPHPAALFLSEIEDMQDFDEDDVPCLEGFDKKTLH